MAENGLGNAIEFSYLILDLFEPSQRSVGWLACCTRLTLE